MQIHAHIDGYGAYNTGTIQTDNYGCAAYYAVPGFAYRVFVDYRVYTGVRYQGGSDWQRPTFNNWYMGQFYVVMVRG